MKIEESRENYLKIIYLLEKKGPVRAVDIAKELGFSKPSVSRAVHLLEDAGLLNIADNGELKLTPEGFEKADDIVNKNETIKLFFISCLGISVKEATNEACRIEHIISDETFQAMKKRLKNSCWLSHNFHKESL